jgi:competence ComEA-like helix-hairpin-helix protein
MTLTRDEQQALAFIAVLLFLSAALRIASLPERAAVPGEPVDLDAHIAATARAVGDAERMAEPLAPDERLDPNTAPAVELARLPRVGPALARRIVEDRERNGPFRRAGDLARVAGVGDRLVELATPHLSIPPGRSAPDPAMAARPWPEAGGAGSAGVRSVVGGAGGRIDVNAADAALLETLPGVGPVLAARIVAYRDSVGRFASPEELLSVRGVGEATLARLRGQVEVRP